MSIQTFSAKNFRAICDQLAVADKDLRHIIHIYGYPPMWTRPNTFETLVHIILEQQVSLASALAALKKLQEKTKGITARKILALSDDELRACYVSRQKTLYLKALATALVKKKLDLEVLTSLPDEEIRVRLTAIKGIGNWTTDVYLMFVLQRTDIFPIGDLAAVNALKRIKKLTPERASQEAMLRIINRWKPNRSVAAMILWHFYLSAPKRKTNLAPVAE